MLDNQDPAGRHFLGSGLNETNAQRGSEDYFGNYFAEHQDVDR